MNDRQITSKTNFYSTFGIPETEEDFLKLFEIQSAFFDRNEKEYQKDLDKIYRAKAAQYHPDTNSSEEAKHIYPLLKPAYEVLSNPIKRDAYFTLRESKTSVDNRDAMARLSVLEISLKIPLNQQNKGVDRQSGEDPILAAYFKKIEEEKRIAFEYPSEEDFKIALKALPAASMNVMSIVGIFKRLPYKEASWIEQTDDWKNYIQTLDDLFILLAHSHLKLWPLILKLVCVENGKIFCELPNINLYPIINSLNEHIVKDNNSSRFYSYYAQSVALLIRSSQQLYDVYSLFQTLDPSLEELGLFLLATFKNLNKLDFTQSYVHYFDKNFIKAIGADFQKLNQPLIVEELIKEIPSVYWVYFASFFSSLSEQALLNLLNEIKLNDWQYLPISLDVNIILLCLSHSPSEKWKNFAENAPIAVLTIEKLLYLFRSISIDSWEKLAVFLKTLENSKKLDLSSILSSLVLSLYGEFQLKIGEGNKTNQLDAFLLTLKELTHNENEFFKCLKILRLDRATKILFLKQLHALISSNEIFRQIEEWANAPEESVFTNTQISSFLSSVAMLYVIDQIDDVNKLAEIFNKLICSTDVKAEEITALLCRKKHLLTHHEGLAYFLLLISQEEWIVLAPLDILDLKQGFNKAINLFNLITPKDWYWLGLLLKMSLAELNLNSKISEFFMEFAGLKGMYDIVNLPHLNTLIQTIVGEDRQALNAVLNILRNSSYPVNERVHLRTEMNLNPNESLYSHGFWRNKRSSETDDVEVRDVKRSHLDPTLGGGNNFQ